ncbi:hypothetical protein AMK59_5198 [Oryctes borbonicus]|uniref:FAST kinase leucine-rich domain-containing protein n=1 Tax=Oryctes borbonicus TaxID=1629725 RepID=A0A0T6B0N9_9SCAR|nr:hypothetical protein AMK59_5198 [Oryctes borbonicus]
MAKYVKRISKLLNTNKIGSTDYKVIINALMLLSLPQWRDKNAALIIRCISLMKDHLHLLNVNELLVVHEIFCKIQEPAHMLNEIQRCASKYLLQLEEEMSPQLDIRLKLFSCITYFAPPSQRPHFKKIVQQYIDYKLDGPSLLELHKIVLFTKTSDNGICQKFWEKLTSCLSDSAFVDLYIFKICQNYIDFISDLPDHRSIDFEVKMLAILEHGMKHKLLGIIPSYFPTVASFILIFGNNRQTVDMVIAKIKEFRNYFNAIDCFHLSYALYNVSNQNLLSNIDIINIKYSLDKCTYNILKSNCDTVVINLLFKSYIYRNSSDSSLFHRLVSSYKNDMTLYSTLLKNVVYNLFVTNTLVPDVMNWLIEYIIQQKDDILGYNIERILHLCYFLGFLPDKHEQFFQTAIDIFLRDQQRLSGLSYLQGCLALCFFNTLPQSFIKQIFNVEFLEKIDVELANCYFKDVYPARVRYLMMQLNRAVCLDYPEANIPWFHQKYIEQRHTDGKRLSARQV